MQGGRDQCQCQISERSRIGEYRGDNSASEITGGNQRRQRPNKRPTPNAKRQTPNAPTASAHRVETTSSPGGWRGRRRTSPRPLRKALERSGSFRALEPSDTDEVFVQAPADSVARVATPLA